jgi:hypothetical protein
MTETSDAVRAAQHTRRRALIVPREHGAWGLLLVPLFTGVVAGFASEHRIWPLLLFTVAALSLFWLRTLDTGFDIYPLRFALVIRQKIEHPQYQ